MFRSLLTPLLLFVPPVAQAAVISGPVTDQSTGRRYAVLEQTTWDLAQAEAITLDANLVTINDQAENDFILNAFSGLDASNFTPVVTPNDIGFWIGINDIVTEGSFDWISGEPSNFTNWAPGEPNNLVLGNEDWGMLYARSEPGQWTAGQWNDAVNVPNQSKPAIIEFNASAVPEPTSFGALAAAAIVVGHRRKQRRKGRAK